jgi:ankyrin repeat protein
MKNTIFDYRQNTVLLQSCAGADANISDKDGETALMYAFRFGTIGMVKELLGAGKCYFYYCCY